MNGQAPTGQSGYLQAWSLRRNPFEDTLDPQFFYAGTALTQRLDLLTHLVQFGESVVIVSGPTGSGKSSLLEQFLGHIDQQWSVCLMDGKQGAQLSEKLSETIGGPPTDDDQALLARWATQQNNTSQHLIILIDNAEHLDEPACQQLCELIDLPDGERLRIVLFGTADTQQHVRSILGQLNSKRTCQVLEIPRFTEEETASYLMYRLAVAGYSGESPFTPTEVRAMCKSADGRPGKINRLAHESLIEHHMRAKNKNRTPLRRSPKKTAAPLWISASVGIAAVAGYLSWQRLSPTIEPEQSTLSSEQAATKRPFKVAETLPSRNTTIDSIVPTTESPPAEQQVIGTVPAGKDSAAIRSLEEAPPLPAGNDKSGMAEKEEPDAAAVQPAPPPAESDSAPQRNTVLPALAFGQPHREDWLLKQPPNTFTLQLLGSRGQSSIATFITSNSLEPAKTAYYRSRYKNADWYVLLYGTYPDKASALAALDAMSDKVKKARPWPRSLKSVQESIHKAQ